MQNKEIEEDGFSIDLTEEQAENFKKVFELEYEKIHKRFENGTETIDDIKKHCLNYMIKTENGVELKLVETKYFEKLIEYIDQLENKVKELEKENTDIKEVYIRTAKHLDKKGMFELSEYLLAQIEATPTFTTWEEYTTWVSKQVIRGKINELKFIPLQDKEERQKINCQIDILQELLEEK